MKRTTHTQPLRALGLAVVALLALGYGLGLAARASATPATPAVLDSLALARG